MYKILHIPTACLIHEDVDYFNDCLDETFIDVKLDKKNISSLNTCILIFKTKIAARKFLTEWLSYEVLHEISSAMFVYRQDLSDSFSSVKKINIEEFEIIKHV